MKASAQGVYSPATWGGPSAMAHVAQLYSLGGFGLPQDLPQARIWYQKAADQGDYRAAYYLGLMYLNGVGGAKDLAQARALFEKAASEGSSPAKRYLSQSNAQSTPAATQPAYVAAQQGNTQQGTCAVVYEADVYFDAGNNEGYGAAWSRTTIQEAQNAARAKLMSTPGGNTLNQNSFNTIATGCTFAHGAVAAKLKTQWQTGALLGPGIYDVITANLAATTNDAVNAAMAVCSNTKGLGGDNEVCAVLDQW